MPDLAIDINGLVKEYPGVTALAGIDLKVRAGVFFGLLGPNGAGKTTTIHILSGLCNKTRGEVRLFGHDLIRDYRACRRLVGLVPQEFNFDLFGRVRKTLEFQGGYFGIPRAACRQRAAELMDLFGLTDKQDTPARHLSGGMKRRLVFARALMHSPRLLILDEPTAGVDVDLRKATWAYLRRINEEGTTIVLTTHYIEEAEALCDDIGVINHGTIVARDSTRNLVNLLHQESIVVTAEEPVSSQAMGVLADYAPSVDAEGFELTLSFDRNAIPYQEVLQRIMESGVTVASIRPADNRLEKVFLHLTQQAPS